MFMIIDRYIAKLFLLFVISGLLTFTTLFLAVDFLSFASQFTDVEFSSLAKYYGYLLPTILYQMLPVACLMAVVFTLSQLNRSNELTALFSSGMSLARVSAPMLVLVALLSAFSFWLGDRVLPRFEQKKNYVEYVEIKKKPGLYSAVTTDKIWYRSENVIFNIKTLNPQKATAQGLTLYYFDDQWELMQMISAASMTIEGPKWKLLDGLVTLFPKEESFPLTQTFQSKVIPMKEELADLKSSAKAADIMSLSELEKFIKRNKDAGLDTVRYEVDYHAKFGFTFATLVMAVMGIPFSVSKTRSGGVFLNIGLCIGLAFFYWALYSSSLTLGKHGAIPPFVAAWSANFLTMAGSVYLLLRLNK
jgi:lipopolysaccharide export system permease protein